MARLQIVEKKGIGTLYAFRGPRSHRLVSLLVPATDWQRHREQLALQKAASRERTKAEIDELMSEEVLAQYDREYRRCGVALH